MSSIFQKKIRDKEKLISQKYVEIEQIKEEIEKMKKELWKSCSHEWERDYSAMHDDPFKYFCKHCKMYKNSYRL